MRFLRCILTSGYRCTQFCILKPASFAKQKCKRSFFTFTGIPVLSTSYIQNINLDEESEEVYNIPVPRNSIQEACNDSLEATTELLNRIFENIADTALQYKTSLNELYSFLEKYEMLKENSEACVEVELAIIGARAKVEDCERRYLELVTVMQSVEKLTKATCELSFLMQEEGLAMALSQTLNSVHESINLDSKEIADIKKKLWKFENFSIMNADTSDTVQESVLGEQETVLEIEESVMEPKIFSSSLSGCISRIGRTLELPR